MYILVGVCRVPGRHNLSIDTNDVVRKARQLWDREGENQKHLISEGMSTNDYGFYPPRNGFRDLLEDDRLSENSTA